MRGDGEWLLLTGLHGKQGSETGRAAVLSGCVPSSGFSPALSCKGTISKVFSCLWPLSGTLLPRELPWPMALHVKEREGTVEII